MVTRQAILGTRHTQNNSRDPGKSGMGQSRDRTTKNSQTEKLIKFTPTLKSGSRKEEYTDKATYRTNDSSRLTFMSSM